MEEIKLGDYVLVRGEGVEVFQVLGLHEKVFFLSNGSNEPREKCILVPKEHHNKIWKCTQEYLEHDLAKELLGEQDITRY
jgi:hypothetical protein